jgi:hypothetical protein
MNTSPLPVKRDLSQLYLLSLLVGLLMTLASLAGIFFQSFLYPAEELRQSFVANDVVNLFIGLPVLIGSMWFARRSRLIGLLFWPGALFYVIYNYVAYTIAMSGTILILSYLFLVVLSIYTMIRVLMSMDTASIQSLLKGVVPERFAGGVLIGFGGLFFLRSISQVAGILTGQITLEGAEFGVLTADLLTTPLWVIGGITLWRKQPLGYAAGAGLLFQVSMLFVGLLIFFILQPFLSTLPFRVDDFVVILVMGLVCFIPFGLYVRGMLNY